MCPTLFLSSFSPRLSCWYRCWLTCPLSPLHVIACFTPLKLTPVHLPFFFVCSQVVSKLIQIREYISKASSMRDDLVEKNDVPANVERLSHLITHLKEQEKSYLRFLQKMLVSLCKQRFHNLMLSHDLCPILKWAWLELQLIWSWSWTCFCWYLDSQLQTVFLMTLSFLWNQVELSFMLL